MIGSFYSQFRLRLSSVQFIFPLSVDPVRQVSGAAVRVPGVGQAGLAEAGRAGACRAERGEGLQPEAVHPDGAATRQRGLVRSDREY